MKAPVDTVVDEIIEFGVEQPLVFLARNVSEQDDPQLLVGIASENHALSVGYPNVTQVAATSWLTTTLQERITTATRHLTEGPFDRRAYRQTDIAMTAVEEDTELVLDRAFDEPTADLCQTHDRRGRKPVPWRHCRSACSASAGSEDNTRRKAFFEGVSDERGLEAATVVWVNPDRSQIGTELDDPDRMVSRVGR